MVEGFNRDPDVHGILVQLPLPAHVSETRVLDAISIDKDVDGFSPANVGALAMRGREPLYVSCTPKVSMASGGTRGRLRPTCGCPTCEGHRAGVWFTAQGACNWAWVALASRLMHGRSEHPNGERGQIRWRRGRTYIDVLVLYTGLH